ncbi:MAG: sugar ABC transporter substrate-binding protein [Clostridia bacterium]|nr:sugar ABC transporter substrate-binding protein [Clostridia bacterium]
MKKLIALVLTLVMLLGIAAVPASAEGKGKILYLSNLNSGAQYEFYVTYLNMMAKELGYTVEIVYADGFNDPAGNLKNVKNAYTSDVVGLIATQDGGLINIMEEYPDLWVVGFFSDFDAVYQPGGTSAGVLDKDHFLGLMGDNFISGTALGEAYAQEVIDRGFKKVATCIFPAYAYPKHTVADAGFRAYIAKHNETAAEPIEIVGDATVLNFSPLDNNTYWFEDGHDELDCIVGFCAGTTFIYPSVLEAKAMGICNDAMQIITGGFDNDPDLMADCGDDKNIIRLTTAAFESIIWPMAMIDAAISGNMYKDYPGNKAQLDSGIMVINSTEKFDAVINNSPMGATNDEDRLGKAQASWDDMKDYFASVNPDATYQALTEYCQSFTVEGYMK